MVERDEAVAQLSLLTGQDLHALAQDYQVTVRTQTGAVNKGWAGHVFERYLGVPINSAQRPDFGGWELKSIPLKHLKNGRLAFKETMAITMIDPEQVADTAFENSHLLAKLRHAVCIARTVGSDVDAPSFIHSVTTLDLEGDLYDAVKRDYLTVQGCIRDPQRGFAALSGRMGVFIQPRTKGAGHGSTTRAFYARTAFLKRFIAL